ncbi:nuclear transport factor 2 family protein [Streptomyces prasinus]|uniref:nuclear transport factor 2 family protein n=1 Tax=Streptomyces prasinus TaxID=67345 RepID=UPI00362A5461
MNAAVGRHVASPAPRGAAVAALDGRTDRPAPLHPLTGRFRDVHGVEPSLGLPGGGFRPGRGPFPVRGRFRVADGFVTTVAHPGRPRPTTTAPLPRPGSRPPGRTPTPVTALRHLSADIEKVHAYYRLVDADDVDGLTALFAPHAVYHRPGYPPLAGRTALDRFYRQERVISRGRHTVTSVTAAGGDVAVQGGFRGELRDGSTVSLRFADFFTLSPEGLFTRRDTYFFSPLV